MKRVIALVLFLVSMSIGSVVFEWDHSPDPLVTHYRLYWGTASGAYVKSQPTLAKTNAIYIDNKLIATNIPHFFVVTAANAAGIESVPSNEVGWTNAARPKPPARPMVNPVDVAAMAATVLSTINP